MKSGEMGEEDGVGSSLCREEEGKELILILCVCVCVCFAFCIGLDNGLKRREGEALKEEAKA